MPIGNPLGYKINLPVIGAVGAGAGAVYVALDGSLLSHLAKSLWYFFLFA